MENQTPDADALHKATTGYNAAIQLMTYEGNLIWNRYNAMLLANTIILTLVGTSLTTDWKMPALLIGALPCSGIVLCCIWRLITQRGFDYHKYWIWRARELEEKFLNPPVVTLQRGEPYAAGEKVEIQTDGKPLALQMREDSRAFTAEFLSYGPIYVFILLYVVELVVLWLRFTPSTEANAFEAFGL